MHTTDVEPAYSVKGRTMNEKLIKEIMENSKPTPAECLFAFLENCVLWTLILVFGILIGFWFEPEFRELFNK